MTVVDYIDLDNDERYVEVVFVDLSTDEDSVEKVNVPEDDSVARSENVAKAAVSSSISEQDATPTTSFSKLEQEHSATASLLIVEHGATTSSLVAEEATQQAEVVVFSSMTAQGAATSLLLTKQGGTTSSLREDKATPSGNQVFVAALDCAKEVTQSENTAKAAGVSSITEGGAVGVKGDAGNAMGSTGTYNLHAEEEPKRDNEKYENCNYEAEPEAHCQEVSQDVLAMSLPPQDKEKEISLCGNFYGRKGKKQASSTECNRQLSIVHSEGVPPKLHNGDSRFSVMGNVRNGTDSTGINVLDAEVPMWTYKGCSKTSQGNTMHGKVHENGSKDCMVEGCTNVAHGGTPLCIFHNSRPHKRCSVVIGCTTAACASSQGRTDCCVKHGGGKRCKYDGCGTGAQGSTDYCIAHGGGRRCKFQGCGKSAQGRSDYCMKHGGGRRCKFVGCSASAACRTDFCSIHRTTVSSGNPAYEMLPAPAPARRAKKAEPSKRRNSHSVIGGRSLKRHTANDYVNTRSFNAVEAGEEKGRVFICQNNTLKAQMNSESGLAAGSPPRKFRKLAEVYCT